MQGFVNEYITIITKIMATIRTLVDMEVTPGLKHFSTTKALARGTVLCINLKRKGNWAMKKDNFRQIQQK